MGPPHQGGPAPPPVTVHNDAMTTSTATTAPGGPPLETGAAIIETVGLAKTYPGTNFKAVDELNLSVGTGEVFGLLGPNGAGKTTTVGVLTTRVIPTGGEAFVGGIDVVRQPTLVKQIIGVVSQQNTLDRQLTPWENLYYHGRLFGIRRGNAGAPQTICSSASN